MLSLFPQILFLAPFSALLMRIALFSLLSFAAWKHLGGPGAYIRGWGAVEMIAGILILMGAWTQIVAIFVFLGIASGFIFPRMRIFPKSTMLLAFVMCLSLLVTGAGAMAFDLPL